MTRSRFDSTSRPSATIPLPRMASRMSAKGLLSDRLAGRDVIRGVEETLVDLRARHKAVDLDRVGALNLDRFQLGIIDNEELGPWRPRSRGLYLRGRPGRRSLHRSAAGAGDCRWPC